MKKIDVLIVFEHKNRELESSILLKEKLIRQGLTAQICQVGWNANLILSTVSPKVVVTPWYYDDTDSKHVRQLRGAYPNDEFKIVNLHCEQLANSTAMKFMIPSGEARFAVHLCWGDFFADHLKKNGIEPLLIYKTGSTRLDFFRPEMRYVSESKEKLAETFGLEKNKKWVLIIGNYSGAFTSEDVMVNLEERGFSNVRRNCEVSKLAYESVLTWLEKLCPQTKEGIELIYRPHPSEHMSEKLLALNTKYAHFHVIKELAIRDWIVNTEVGIMWNSTSAVEAVYGELPIFSLRPFSIPEDLQLPLLENAMQISSAEEMIHCVQTIERNDHVEVNRALKKAMNYYYYKDERLATDITAYVIKTIMNDDSIPTFKGVNCTLFSNIRRIISYMAKYILYKMNLMKKISEYRTLSDNYISRKEFHEIEKRIISSGK